MIRTRTRDAKLNSPEETATLAADLADRLTPGDVVLLSGPIGAGKTHFARHLIQARLHADGSTVEDVPSPTFTLVQTYDTGETEIWHADLYRLSHPDDVEELGLIDAFETAICLVEWPDRLGDLIPQTALSLEFTAPAYDENPDQRHLRAQWSDPRWNKTLDGLFDD